MANKFILGTLILTLSALSSKPLAVSTGSSCLVFSAVKASASIRYGLPIYLLALDISSAGLPLQFLSLRLKSSQRKLLRSPAHLSRILIDAVRRLSSWCLMFFGSSFLIDEHIIRESRAYSSSPGTGHLLYDDHRRLSPRLPPSWQQMTPTALSQIVEQLVRVVVMLGFAALLLPYGLDYAAGGAVSAPAPVGTAAWLVLVYYYYKLKRSFRRRSVSNRKRLRIS